MNKNYTRVGEYTIIETDNGIKTMPTTDNIKDILIQENKVEELKNKQKELNAFLQEDEIKYPEKELLVAFMVCTVSIVLIAAVKRILPSSNIIELGELTSCGIAIGMFFSRTLDYIGNKKKKEKYSNEAEIIDYQLAEEKEKLYSLYKTKENEKKQIYETVNIENNKLYLDQVLSARNVNSKNKTMVKSRFN